MQGVAGKSSLQEEAAFLQCSRGRPIVDVARRFNTEDAQGLKRSGCKCLNGLDHQPLSPVVAGEQIANIDDVAPGTCFKHPHKLPASS